MKTMKTSGSRYAAARANLLMMVLLTLANSLLQVTNSDYNFPFSAFIPQVLVVLGLNKTPGLREFRLGFSILFVAAAFLILLFFFLAYLFSKKKPGFMAAALIVFAADSLIMIILTAFSFETAFIIEYLFHAWVIYYLILGVKHGDAAIFAPGENEAPPASEPPLPLTPEESPDKVFYIPEDDVSKGENEDT